MGFNKKIIRIAEENKAKIISVVIALILVLIVLIMVKEKNLLYFLMGIAFVIAGLPFFISLIVEGRKTQEKDAMFLEFARDLVENVKAGTPISKSIINIRYKDYGSLSPHINKLANQIALGIPLKSALETFSRDIDSAAIKRAVSIISESEKAGGKIEEILESVTLSVSQVERLRKERRAAMYTLVVQGYIIFVIFIAIMLVLEFKILPIASQLSETSGLGGGAGSSMPMGLGGIGFGGEVATPEQLTRPFLYLLIIQGFFAGLVIGKLAEGKIKSGLKHSFIMMILAILISTGARVFLGSPV
jgi:flagellar protein FlaJ